MKSFNYIRTNEWIGLAIGLVITILYLIFATPLYELLYPGSSEYANEMYNNNMYFVEAIILTMTTWGLALIYYIFIDNFPSFWCWFLFLIAALAVAPLVGYYYVNHAFEEFNLDFAFELMNFAFINIAVSGILFFCISICIKGLSKNCSTTPF